MTENKIYYLIRLTGLFYCISFVIALFVFLVFPDNLLNILSLIWNSMINSSIKNYVESKFWISLTGSMMITIITLSYFLFLDPEKYLLMCIPLAIAKFSSSFFGMIFFVYQFLFQNHNVEFVLLTIPITDLPLGMWILLLYNKIQKAKNHLRK